MGRVTYWNEEYGCWSYHCASGDAAKKLAAYENALPCMIGDKMYIIVKDKIKSERVNEISMGNEVFRFRLEYTNYYLKEDIGKTVFLTREEAEAVLKSTGGRGGEQK